MGKGNGEHPPIKFVKDQMFCEFFIFIFMGTSVTLSSLSAGMDDGGSFPYPYFFAGFILAPILFVNLMSRWFVVKSVQKKGVTRKNIIDTLNNTTWGKLIWPWSCRAGMFWCIPGSILTGLAGVNCEIKEKNGNTTVKNTCYFDIEGEHGEMYRGLAIGLVIIHVNTFVYLLLSNCPVHSVLEQIKADRSGTTSSPPAPPAVTSTSNPTQPTSVGGASNSLASSPPDYSEVTSQETANRHETHVEMETRVQELATRVRELEDRHRDLREQNALPLPPSYNELMESASNKSNGTLPESPFS